ncbi:arginase family protein [Kitasatospora sp. NPDC096147]|uniref:arginase family protein n=1 Tax=Kitasatospora sp. NPDC096147 TaxID=3364093 RepID=UPI003827E1E5
MRRVSAAEGFLGAEAWRANGRWDVVVVGLPYSGSSAAGRADLGPGMVRSVSRTLGQGPLAGPAKGWYDRAEQELLCAGLTFADAGDLRMDPLNAGQDLDLVPEVLERLRGTCRLLVVLGGDDSLGYWVHEGFTGVLVHLDADEDAQQPRCPSGPTRTDFIRHLERAEGLRIVQYGQRGLVQGPPEPPGDNRDVARDVAELKSLVAGSGAAACAVSLDVSVFDPGVVRSVATPLPDGLTAEQLGGALRAVGSAGVPVRQLAVTEFAPDGAEGAVGRLDAMRLVQLVIRACHDWLT